MTRATHFPQRHGPAALMLSLIMAVLLAGMAFAGPGSSVPGFVSGDLIRTDAGGVDLGYTVAVLSDGRILAGGTSNRGGDAYEVLLVGYAPDGSLDLSFGREGVVTTALDGTGVAYALAGLGDGGIVAAGTSDSGDELRLVVLRYLADGTLDPAFDEDGIVSRPIERDLSTSLAVTEHPDGAIVVARYTRGEDGVNLLLTRFNPDGSPDEAFGADGAALLPFGGAGGPLALRALADGSLLVVGSAPDEGGIRMTVARYVPPAGDGEAASFSMEWSAVLNLGNHLATALHQAEDGRAYLAAYFASDTLHAIWPAERTVDGAWTALVDGDDAGPMQVDVPIAEAYGIALLSDSRVIVAGTEQDDITLRLYAGGTGLATAIPTDATASAGSAASPTATPTRTATPASTTATPGPVSAPRPAPPGITVPFAPPALPVSGSSPTPTGQGAVTQGPSQTSQQPGGQGSAPAPATPSGPGTPSGGASPAGTAVATTVVPPPSSMPTSAPAGTSSPSRGQAPTAAPTVAATPSLPTPPVPTLPVPTPSLPTPVLPTVPAVPTFVPTPAISPVPTALPTSVPTVAPTQKHGNGNGNCNRNGNGKGPPRCRED